LSLKSRSQKARTDLERHEQCALLSRPGQRPEMVHEFEPISPWTTRARAKSDDTRCFESGDLLRRRCIAVEVGGAWWIHPRKEKLLERGLGAVLLIGATGMARHSGAIRELASVRPAHGRRHKII
jgi:hypothetical protein